jgi:hypothetical protein
MKYENINRIRRTRMNKFTIAAILSVLAFGLMANKCEPTATFNEPADVEAPAEAPVGSEVPTDE